MILVCPSGCTLVEPSQIAGLSRGQSVVLLICSVCSSVTRLSKYSLLCPSALLTKNLHFASKYFFAIIKISLSSSFLMFIPKYHQIYPNTWFNTQNFRKTDFFKRFDPILITKLDLAISVIFSHCLDNTYLYFWFYIALELCSIEETILYSVLEKLSKLLFLISIIIAIYSLVFCACSFMSE